MDFQDQFDQAIQTYASNNQYGVSAVPAHTHNHVDSLAVSYLDLDNKTRYILYRILAPTSSTAVANTVGGDFVMPLSGYITSVGATVDTAGTTGATDIRIKVNGSSIMSTDITIDSGSKTSRNASTKPLVNGAAAAFKTGDIFTFDVTAISTTPANGLTIFINIVETD